MTLQPHCSQQFTAADTADWVPDKGANIWYLHLISGVADLIADIRSAVTKFPFSENMAWPYQAECMYAASLENDPENNAWMETA